MRSRMRSARSFQFYAPERFPHVARHRARSPDFHSVSLRRFRQQLDLGAVLRPVRRWALGVTGAGMMSWAWRAILRLRAIAVRRARRWSASSYAFATSLRQSRQRLQPRPMHLAPAAAFRSPQRPSSTFGPKATWRTSTKRPATSAARGIRACSMSAPTTSSQRRSWSERSRSSTRRSRTSICRVGMRAPPVGWRGPTPWCDCHTTFSSRRAQHGASG